MTHISPATEQALRKLPKAELHLHIEAPRAGTGPETGRTYNISLPFADLDDLKAHYEFENLQSFLDLYYQLMSVLRTKQDFTDLMLAYLARANADGVRRAEIFFDPQVHMNNGLDFDVVLDGLLEGLRIGHERFGIDGGLIMCIIRDMPVDSAEALLDTAASTGRGPARYRFGFRRSRISAGTVHSYI